jgi:hypothetical protein
MLEDKLEFLQADRDCHLKDLMWQLTFENIDWDYFNEVLEATKTLDATCKTLEESHAL